jgi:hypothetical protein
VVGRAAGWERETQPIAYRPLQRYPARKDARAREFALAGLGSTDLGPEPDSERECKCNGWPSMADARYEARLDAETEEEIGSDGLVNSIGSSLTIGPGSHSFPGTFISFSGAGAFFLRSLVSS